MQSEKYNSNLWDLGPSCGEKLFQCQSNSGILEVRQSMGLRWMHFGNGAVETVMSIDHPNRIVLPYAQAMMSFLLFNSKPKNILNFGLGGGAFVRFTNNHFPDTRITTVEKSKQVVNICITFFNINYRNSMVIVDEGGNFLRTHINNGNAVNHYDTLLIDLYDDSGMADCMEQQQFYDDCYSALTEDGVAVLNITYKNEESFKRVMLQLMSSFENRILFFNLEGHANIIALGFKRDHPNLLDSSLMDQANFLEHLYSLQFSNFANSIIQTHTT